MNDGRPCLVPARAPTLPTPEWKKGWVKRRRVFNSITHVEKLQLSLPPGPTVAAGVGAGGSQRAPQQKGCGKKGDPGNGMGGRGQMGGGGLGATGTDDDGSLPCGLYPSLPEGRGGKE